MRLAPENIQPIGDEIAIRWNDGTESFFQLADLRRHCPCAACGGEPDVLGKVVRPAVNHGPRSFDLASISPVGGYALQLEWGDGHSTGLYTFRYLKQLEAAAAAGALP